MTSRIQHKHRNYISWKSTSNKKNGEEEMGIANFFEWYGNKQIKDVCLNIDFQNQKIVKMRLKILRSNVWRNVYVI